VLYGLGKELGEIIHIRLGVTGHRTLPNKEKLSEKIREALERKIFDLFDEDLKKLLNSSPQKLIAFTILTPLAEGADRLVTREVLKLASSKIEVVLPLAKEDYLQDFKAQESISEFEELLSRAAHIIALRKQMLKETYSESNLEEARCQAYEDVGHYVVDHCDALIALWDRKKSRGKGGTAEIVDYARAKKRPLIIISTALPYDIFIEKGNGLRVTSLSGDWQKGQ